MPSAAVVHLLRAQNKLACFERFMTSYRAMEAGLAHDLIVVFKGFHDRNKGPAEALLEGVRHRVVEVHDSGFDVGPYLEVARDTAYERICFVNSFSRILTPSWLAHLSSALDTQPRAGLVGATGSWEGIAADVPFPNYHLRTTGFLIDRALLVDLDFWDMREKFDANLFEAGPRSLTRQILARGLEPYVVDRNGRAFAKEDWDRCDTFRAGEQAGLMIADRRTDAYQESDSERRGWLHRRAFWADPGKRPRKKRFTRRLSRILGILSGH